jgi:hypothetical protein
MRRMEPKPGSHALLFEMGPSVLEHKPTAPIQKVFPRRGAV